MSGSGVDVLKNEVPTVTHVDINMRAAASAASNRADRGVENPKINEGGGGHRYKERAGTA